MTAHTPGPWKMSMVCVRGRGKHSIFRPWIVQEIQGEHGGICEVFVSGNDGRNITGEDKANARLIAAAPELLAVAIEALAYLQDPNGWEKKNVHEHRYLPSLLRDSIAKARGTMR